MASPSWQITEIILRTEPLPGQTIGTIIRDDRRTVPVLETRVAILPEAVGEEHALRGVEALVEAGVVVGHAGVVGEEDGVVAAAADAALLGGGGQGRKGQDEKYRPHLAVT